MSFLEFAPKTGSRRFAALFAATLLATTCAASAGTLTYTDGTITGLGMTFLTPTTGYGIAGQIHLTTADGTFDVWCVDLTDDFVTTGGTYHAGPALSLPFAPGVPRPPLLSLTQIGEMGALALHGDSLVANPGPYTADEVAAAIQIAMWDIEYQFATPTFTYDALGSPVDAAPPDPSGLVAQYIADVEGGPWVEDFDFAVLSEAGNQTVIWAPEPHVHIRVSRTVHLGDDAHRLRGPRLRRLSPGQGEAGVGVGVKQHLETRSLRRSRWLGKRASLGCAFPPIAQITEPSRASVCSCSWRERPPGSRRWDPLAHRLSVVIDEQGDMSGEARPELRVEGQLALSPTPVGADRSFVVVQAAGKARVVKEDAPRLSA
jgi:hypothetical protein